MEELSIKRVKIMVALSLVTICIATKQECMITRVLAARNTAHNILPSTALSL